MKLVDLPRIIGRHYRPESYVKNDSYTISYSVIHKCWCYFNLRGSYMSRMGRTAVLLDNEDLVECDIYGNILNKEDIPMKLTYDYFRPIFYENLEEMEDAYAHGVRNKLGWAGNASWPRVSKTGDSSARSGFSPSFIRWPELKECLIAEQCPKHKQGNEMKDVNYIGGSYDVVAVMYVDDANRAYNFKIDKSLTVKEGDLVVVESSNGLGLAYVKTVYANIPANAEHINKATAWVVNVVDTSAQDARKDATEKRTHIMTQLEEKKKSMEAIEMYALLAKHDPEAAKLIEELKALGQ